MTQWHLESRVFACSGAGKWPTSRAPPLREDCQGPRKGDISTLEAPSDLFRRISHRCEPECLSRLQTLGRQGASNPALSHRSSYLLDACIRFGDKSAHHQVSHPSESPQKSSECRVAHHFRGPISCMGRKYPLRTALKVQSHSAGVSPRD